MQLLLLLAVLCIFSDAAVIHPKHGQMHAKKRQESTLSSTTGTNDSPEESVVVSTSTSYSTFLMGIDLMTNAIEVTLSSTVSLPDATSAASREATPTTADSTPDITSAPSDVGSSSMDASDSGSSVSSKDPDSTSTAAVLVTDAADTESTTSTSTAAMTDLVSSTTAETTWSTTVPKGGKLVQPWPDNGTIRWCAEKKDEGDVLEPLINGAYTLWQEAGLGSVEQGAPSVHRQAALCEDLLGESEHALNQTLWIDVRNSTYYPFSVRPNGFMKGGSRMAFSLEDNRVTHLHSRTVSMARALGRAWGLRWETQNRTLWDSNRFTFLCNNTAHYASYTTAVNRLLCANQVLASDERFIAADYLPMLNNRAPGLAKPHKLDMLSIMLFSTYEHARNDSSKPETSEGSALYPVLGLNPGDGSFVEIAPRQKPSRGDIERLNQIYPGDWVRDRRDRD